VLVRTCLAHISILLLVVAATGVSEPDFVEVQSWQPPRTGWLYVIDATHEGSGARVFLFDAERGEIAGVIRTGYSPDVALSARGDRLYVASALFGCRQPNCDRLTVIDTRLGRVLSTTPIPNRVTYGTYPDASRMAVSADGRTVYVLTWQGPPSGDAPVALAAFDALRARFLDGAIDLGPCGGGGFVPATDDSHLGFLCPASNEAVFYRLTAPDRATFEFSVRLPWGKRLFAQHVYTDVSARAFMLSADRRGLYVAGGDGAVSEVNLALGSVRETLVPGDRNEVVAPFASPGALEPARFYVAVGPYDGRGTAREIRVFDTNTWARLGTIRTSAPFRTSVATPDGSVIYALTADRAGVLAIDAVAQRELRAMPLGRAPSLALIAP